MKNKILLFLPVIFNVIVSNGQVTQINSNKSLQLTSGLSNKAIYVSDIDQTLWVTDGTLLGTIQLSNQVTYDSSGGVLNNKFIFAGKDATNGSELWITDGTPGGTVILKDINPGVADSRPADNFSLLNGFLYFTAIRPAEGRELWRTDGSPAGTTLVKDIVTGPVSSNLEDHYFIFSTGTFLLFNAITATEGEELWKSDGSGTGTILLKDINTGVPSSSPGSMYKYSNMYLFLAEDNVNGRELWKTDGTALHTELVKNINPGAASSSILGFYTFNGIAYFAADNGTDGSELWRTDGTEPNTTLLKDIESTIPGFGSTPFVILAVTAGNKFIFPAYTFNDGEELWQSDGTAFGTTMFKDINPGTDGSNPFIFIDYSSYSGNGNPALFQGNKFFFQATTATEGTELWISNGTAIGTTIVKDINPGLPDGLGAVSYYYTSAALYFSATDAVHGEELWQSDGSLTGTTMVADINPSGNANISLGVILNNKLIFQATNGDNAAWDLYRLDAPVTPIPVKLSDFTVVRNNKDAILQWKTLQEFNTRNFTIERSFDGLHFEQVGIVLAAGSSTIIQSYQFTDKDIINTPNAFVYYRLLIADNDGKKTYSNIAVLKLKMKAEWSVRLLNNPVKDHLDIIFSEITEEGTILMMDISGRELYRTVFHNIETQLNISTEKLLPGIYTLVAESKNIKKVLRFVKR